MPGYGKGEESRQEASSGSEKRLHSAEGSVGEGAADAFGCVAGLIAMAVVEEDVE